MGFLLYNMQNNTVVYRHRRLDTFEVFYVGIGNKKRPYEKRGRNNLWNKIVSKTPYQVEIIQENFSWEEACELEVLLISLYGRKNTRTGCLANMTDGGEGVIGVEITEETRRRMSQNHANYKLENHPGARKVINTETKEIFNTSTEVSNMLGMHRETFSEYLRGRRKNRTPFVYLDDYIEGMKVVINKNETKKIVLNLETGIFYNSAKEALETHSMHPNTFYCMLNGKRRNKTSFQYV